MITPLRRVNVTPILNGERKDSQPLHSLLNRSFLSTEIRSYTLKIIVCPMGMSKGESNSCVLAGH
jgi:hypothetical protein